MSVSDYFTDEELESQLRLQLQQSSHNDSQSSLMHSPNLLQQ